MKKSGILIFLLTGCLIHALGQETLRFHADPALFIQEARAFFGEGQPERSRAILLKYEHAQNKGLLEENQWIDLAKKANTIEKLGAQPFPDFFSLLESYLEIATHVKNQSDYFTWSAQLDKLLTDDKRSLNLARSFLNFSLAFSQKGILYKSAACQWKVSSGQNEFGKDSLFYVVISGSDLVASVSGDSTVIFATRGKYYPESHSFFGQGGRITWEKLKIQADQVYVNLNKYSLNLSKSVYSIDSVNLIDKRYFTEPLIGQVENKILPGVGADVAGYPRFTSYELRNRIKNIYPGMDYEGGFSLQGLKVIGTGLPSQKGILTIYRNDKPVMRLACAHFTFKPDQSRGINAEASIYLETDSIYHPGLSFQYNSNLKEISLIRDGQGLSPSRYLNYYHGYDLDAGWIRWRMDDSFMTISGLPGSTEKRASFESSDFFNMDRFNEILIADKVHPVSAVKQCADHYYSRDYTLADLSSFMGKPQHLVEEMLLKLSFYGFVRYNTDNQLISVQERAYDFLKKNAGLQDYDIIRFESVQPPEDENALLDLNTNHL
ncbi:MAG: hypothetical protein PHY99_08700, partial [Bacteroidales bacterium]|nr:hypothetical protein [Bacteroidales bacterium]